MRAASKIRVKQPRFSVEKVDADSPLSESHISRLFDGKSGVTLLVRSANGGSKRGGYFFCIAKKDDGMFALETMTQIHVADFSLGELTRFVNHAAGLQFDETMLHYCQSSINFRSDSES